MGIFDGLKNMAASVTSSTAGSIVDSVGNLANSLFNTRADKDKAAQFEANMKETVQTALDAHQEKMEGLYAQTYSEQLKDIQDARNMEIKLNESTQASWLSKNINSFLTLLVASIWGGMTTYIVLRLFQMIEANPNVNMTAVLTVYAGICGTMGILMNFHFGSSKSSQDKDNTIATIAKS